MRLKVAAFAYRKDEYTFLKKKKDKDEYDQTQILLQQPT